LKESLVHAVGASDYVPFNEVLLERKSVQERDASIFQLSEQLAAAQAKVDELMAIERMAKRWTEEMGRNFAEEVEFQHDLDREDGLE
jgi:hypothetical protein